MKKPLNNTINFPTCDSRTVTGVLALTLITAKQYDSISSVSLVEIAQTLATENVLECSEQELEEIKKIASNSELTALEKAFIHYFLLTENTEEDATV